MQDFYLIRHGETDWNVKLAKLQGHSDIPLNEKGILQAKALAPLTESLKIDRIISSDLCRALETAQHMSNFQAQIETHRDLREVHLGIGEGLSWDEVTARLGTEFRTHWSHKDEMHMDLRFPQGESRREVITRVKNCLLHFLQKYQGERLAFVTHGYVIRTLVYHLTPLESSFLVPNCAVVPFSIVNDQMIYRGPETSDQLIQPRVEL